MKKLSFIVPCYNAAIFMHKCIESLLIGGKDIEILLINDGSSDDTGVIADAFAAEHTDIIRVFHQQNKGHGGAVNTGIQNARGKYVKVVDSDDWVDISALKKILDELTLFAHKQQEVDMFICNYVYEKAGAKNKKVMSYDTVLKEKTILTWNNVGHLPAGKYILMHSVIYRTALLRECGLVLPEHTFYVDNLYVYQPLPYVKSLYYLNVDFYRYFIGREGQSIQENVMLKRMDQQLRVNKLMLEATKLNELPNPRQKSYMLSYLGIITAVSSILLIKSGTPQHLAMKKELWQNIKQADKQLYRKLRFNLLGILVNMPHFISKAVYTIAQKIYKFN